MLNGDSTRGDNVSPLALIAKRLHQRNTSLGGDFSMKNELSKPELLVQSTTANTKEDSMQEKDFSSAISQTVELQHSEPQIS